MESCNRRLPINGRRISSLVISCAPLFAYCDSPGNTTSSPVGGSLFLLERNLIGSPIGRSYFDTKADRYIARDHGARHVN